MTSQSIYNQYHSTRKLGMAKHIITLLLVTLTSLSSAQNTKITPKVLPAQGGHPRVSNFGLSYTVGQPISNPLSNGNLRITQGYQQVDASSVNISIDNRPQSVNGCHD